MKKILLVFIIAFAISLNGQAQEDPQASKFENVTYHRLVKVDFKPGTYFSVKKILDTYMEAGKSAGVKGPEVYWLMSGDYDVLFLWTLEGGMSDLEWFWSPDDIKWRNAMIELLGSEDKFKEMRKEWSSYVLKSTSEIARRSLN